MLPCPFLHHFCPPVEIYSSIRLWFPFPMLQPLSRRPFSGIIWSSISPTVPRAFPLINSSPTTLLKKPLDKVYCFSKPRPFRPTQLSLFSPHLLRLSNVPSKIRILSVTPLLIFFYWLPAFLPCLAPRAMGLDPRAPVLSAGCTILFPSTPSFLESSLSNEKGVLGNRPTCFSCKNPSFLQKSTTFQSRQSQAYGAL